jgi:hypothetical protein
MQKLIGVQNKKFLNIEFFTLLDIDSVTFFNFFRQMFSHSIVKSLKKFAPPLSAIKR